MGPSKTAATPPVPTPEASSAVKLAAQNLRWRLEDQISDANSAFKDCIADMDTDLELTIENVLARRGRAVIAAEESRAEATASAALQYFNEQVEGLENARGATFSARVATESERQEITRFADEAGVRAQASTAAQQDRAAVEVKEDLDRIEERVKTIVRQADQEMELR